MRHRRGEGPGSSPAGKGPVIRFVWVLVLMCGGCSFGIGSAYVGQWRAHDETAFTVCVENEAGECESQQTVITHVPERSYWGLTLTYPTIGVAASSRDGDRFAAFRMELSAEFLKGRGERAFGGRAGALLDFGGDATLMSVPVMAVAHYGFSKRFGFYGAAGYSPYSELSFVADEPSLVSHVGWRAVAGLQIVALITRNENRLIWVFEGDRMAANFGDLHYRSWGLTGHLELSF